MQTTKKKEDKDKKRIEKFSNTFTDPWFIVGLILIAIIVFAIWYNRELFYKPINHQRMHPVQVYHPPVKPVYNPPRQYRGLVPPIKPVYKPQVAYKQPVYNNQFKPQVAYKQPVYNNQFKPQVAYKQPVAPQYYNNQAPVPSAPQYYNNQAPLPSAPPYYDSQPPLPSAPPGPAQPVNPISLAQLGKGLEHLTDTPSTISAKYLNEGTNWDEFRQIYKISDELSELDFVDMLRNSLQKK